MSRRIVIHNHFVARTRDASTEVARIVQAYKSKSITRERAIRLLEEQGVSAKELDK